MKSCIFISLSFKPGLSFSFLWMGLRSIWFFNKLWGLKSTSLLWFTGLSAVSGSFYPLVYWKYRLSCFECWPGSSLRMSRSEFVSEVFYPATELPLTLRPDWELFTILCCSSGWLPDFVINPNYLNWTPCPSTLISWGTIIACKLLFEISLLGIVLIGPF